MLPTLPMQRPLPPRPSPLMLQLHRQLGPEGLRQLGPEGLPRQEGLPHQEGLLPCQEGPLPCPEGLPRRGQPDLESYGSSPPRRPSAHQMLTELLLVARALGLARLYAMARSPCRPR